MQATSGFCGGYPRGGHLHLEYTYRIWSYEICGRMFALKSTLTDPEGMLARKIGNRSAIQLIDFRHHCSPWFMVESFPGWHAPFNRCTCCLSFSFITRLQLREVYFLDCLISPLPSILCSSFPGKAVHLSGALHYYRIAMSLGLVVICLRLAEAWSG